MVSVVVLSPLGSFGAREAFEASAASLSSSLLRLGGAAACMVPRKNVGTEHAFREYVAARDNRIFAIYNEDLTGYTIYNAHFNKQRP